MTQLFANNASSTLASGITDVATSITLAVGTGARFPAPTGIQFFLVTLYQKAGAGESNHEIVRCTARAGDVLTVVRAQEGTAARGFASADPIELRATAGTLGSMHAGNITAGDLAAARITNALSATGAAPIFACRAWANFSGFNTGAIRGSGNVSSITDNGVGDYTINFTSAMPDTNYCFSMSATDDGTGVTSPTMTNGFGYGGWKRGPNSTGYSTTSMRFQVGYDNNATLYDQTHINVAIFR